MTLFFKKWQKGLSKTRSGFLARLSNALSGKNKIDDDILEAIEQLLIESDVSVDTTFHLIGEIKKHAAEKGTCTEDELRSILKINIQSVLDNGIEKTSHNQQKPQVILVVGVNGTGKTTSIGKLAYYFHQEGKKVLLAGADTFRAAAGEQLEIWAKRVDVDMIKQPPGADPASVAFDAMQAALARGVDVLLIDTAGRLHTKVNLMEELKKIRRVLSKQMETAPHETLLVLDATTGQNGLVQARQFADAVDISGIVLTKLDGTARGGIAVTIHRELNIPVQWVGLGEGMDDLVPFDASNFVEGMFG